MGSCQIKTNSWMPIAFGVFVSLGIILSFILHYTRDEVYNFPQISEAAGNQPQSGIFCIFLFLAVFVGFTSMLLRFASVHDTNQSSSKIVKTINVLSIVPGILSLVGMILVAAYPLSLHPQTFQPDWFQVAIKPHQIGSIILFVCVNVYFVFQTVLTIILWKKEGIILCCIRSLVVILTITAYIVMKVIPSPKCEENRTNEEVEDIQNIASLIDFCKQSGRYYDTVAISELFLAIFLVVYFLTFCKEFHRISLSTVIKFEDHRVYSKAPTELSATTQL